MRLIQFELPQKGRRVGQVVENTVFDLTSQCLDWTSIYTIFGEARRGGKTIERLIKESVVPDRMDTIDYDELWARAPGDPGGWLLPPLDHPDPAHTHVCGTGLTHLGSMSARSQMHQAAADTHKTDSQRMFEMGLEGGKPAPGTRGIEPECFVMGSGLVVRAHREPLVIPSFAKDGGEEPELVGCYIVDLDGQPYRLGFAMGNEWADHATERVNYLWLASSKLRDCAIGPELITDETFEDVRGACRIMRGDEVIYDSGELLTGEANMTHTLANMEDHHFKYDQFRAPGDVHFFFFGTMKLSYDQRGPLQTGDVIEVSFEGMGLPLINAVLKAEGDGKPVTILKG